MIKKIVELLRSVFGSSGEDLTQSFSHFYQDAEHLKSRNLKQHEMTVNVDNMKLYSIVCLYNSYYRSLHLLPKQRLEVQRLFLVVHATLFSITGYVLSHNGSKWVFSLAVWKRFIFMLLPFVSVWILCYIWFCLLKEYDDLHYAFIQLIRKMEESIPIKPLTVVLQAADNFKLNINLGKLTKLFPVLFAVLYSIMFVSLLVN